MLAIAVRYLTGRLVATDVVDRHRPEWPPHPGRLFMALVAAWGSEGRREDHRAALCWLERQPPPCIHHGEHLVAPAPPTFVPVNDDLAANHLPGSPLRKERYFPSVILPAEEVVFSWPCAEANAEHRQALARLCGAVTYLGHSRTLVGVRLAEEVPPPTLVPVSGCAEQRLRIATEGRFQQLEADFVAGRRPSHGGWHGYAAPGAAVASRTRGHFGSGIIVLKRVAGQRLVLPATQEVTRVVRGALMANAVQPVPEVLSGHGADGGPSRKPHLAIVPLADVGHPHAEGAILGVGLLLPSEAAERDADAVAAAAAAIERLVFGRLGRWDVGSVPPDDVDRVALRAETWTRRARSWSTLTPVVLDRFPKREGGAEQIVAQALVNAGLPEPVSVVCSAVSLHAGAPHARDFPALDSRGARRWHTHAVVTFEDEVEGPVLAGAGRYRGYGFFRPITPGLGA